MATQTFQVRVDARIPWQTTDISVQEGDRLRIEVPNPSLPNVNHPKPWPWGPNCDPDGNRSDEEPRFKWDDAIAPDLFVFALVGRIGESGTPFFVGSSFDQPASASGYLYLSYNDGVNFNDNSGYWDAVVTVEPSCPGGGCWNDEEGKCAYSYWRTLAVNYALEYSDGANHHNPAYVYYTGSASNCANFVSQALRAGNHPPAYPNGADIGHLHASEMSPSLNSITSHWFCLYDAMERLVGTEAWEIAEHLAAYLESLPQSASETESVGGNGNYTLTTQQLDDIAAFAMGLSNAGLGYADIIYWSETVVTHVAFVVGWGPRAVGGTTIDSWDAWNNLAEKPTPVADYQSGYVPYMVDNGREDVGDVANPIPYYLMRLAPVSFFGPVEFIKAPGVVFVDPGDYVTPVF